MTNVNVVASLCYTFGGLAATAVVDPGQALTIFTQDFFGGRVTGPDTPLSEVCDQSQINPVTGPYFVRGAEPGDSLAVHFVSVIPARDWGVSATSEHFGALTANHDPPLLRSAPPERVWRYDIDLATATARFAGADIKHEVMLPLAPMHGTVGVAPSGGLVYPTLTSGPYGGNLSTQLICAGATLYLGVNQPGALFALGDGHARQGDGELCGLAIACPMTNVVVIELVKDVYTPWPRVETDTHLACIGTGRPLDDAVRRSAFEMVRWIQQLSGMDAAESLQLLGQISALSVGNMCGPAYTASTVVAKTLLPRGVIEPYSAVHQRLRGLHRAPSRKR